MLSETNSLISALEAIAQGRYSEGIDILEMFLQLSLNPKSEEYIQVRKGLIEAYYQTGKQEKAIWLCQQLTASHNSDIKAWGQEKLAFLSNTQEITIESTKPIEQNCHKFIHHKTINEFKEFYRDNLLETLKSYEKGRQQALVAITVSGMIALSTISAVSIGAWKITEGIRNSVSNRQTIQQPRSLTYENYVWVENSPTRSRNSQTKLRTSPTRPRNSRNRFRNPQTITNKLVLPKQEYSDLERTEYIPKISTSRRSSNLYFKIISIAVVIDFFVLTAWVAFYSSCIEVYHNQFKNKIIQKIIDFIDLEQAFKYLGDPLLEDNYQTRLAFIHSQMFPKAYQTSYIYQSDRDVFEPRLFQSMLSFTPLREYFEDLQLMFGIVEDLNLNQRIWKTQ